MLQPLDQQVDLSWPVNESHGHSRSSSQRERERGGERERESACVCHHGPHFCNITYISALKPVEFMAKFSRMTRCAVDLPHSIRLGCRSPNLTRVISRVGIAGGWGGVNPQFMSTDAHFWVKYGFKFESLCKIPNISTSDRPLSSFRSIFQHW